MKHKWMAVLAVLALGLMASCSLWEPDMGNDLLPPRDGVVLHDTVFYIPAATMPGLPLMTADRTYSPASLYMLGTLNDTLGGISEASVFTQFNATASYIPAPNTEIDSVVFYLYVDNYIGNIDEALTFRLHESDTRIYFDSLYYSDFPTDGNYNPVVLAESTIYPDNSDTIKMVIEDQSFINKFLAVQDDSALFYNDSLFKDYFKGFYLEASSSASEGAMASIGLSHVVSRLMVRYSNDSIEVDSTAERDFKWATFTINEYFSQKVNVYNHDYTGTLLEGILANSDTEYPYCFTQGLGGVDTRLDFEGVYDWLDGEKVAISSATLVLSVVSEDEGGLTPDEQAERLMLYNEIGEDSLQYLYDYLVIAQSGSDVGFGGQIAPESKGMFYDTTYNYRFSVGLYTQYLVEKEIPNYPVRLQVNRSTVNPEISMLWSNLYTNPKRIRLELVYLKL